MNSPLCQECLKVGVQSPQTYRVRGIGAKTVYKCGTCKRSFSGSAFSPIDFTWKEDPDSWEQWMRSKGIEIKKVVKNVS